MATTLSPTFGDALRRQRMAAGLTQEELAERAGLSVRAISDLERGARHVPRRGTLQLLLDALELSAPERTALEAAARRLEGSLGRKDRDPLDRLLTAPAAPFLGRERELGMVCELVRRPDVRLLTLIGPGGIGKTRLALQVAGAVRGDFEDGVFFVSLAALSTPELVLPAIAEAVGVREAGKSALQETLQDFLGEQRILLVLDNFEHLLPARAALAALLDSCPRLTVLVTSRTVLRLARERTVDVPPLRTPVPEELQDLESIGRHSAVALFCDRAQTVKPDFVLTAANAAAVIEICHRLDGLPLAIELAAARIRVLPPGTLVTQLANRLRLLTGGAVDTPLRHQTLRGAVEWSYSLLDEPERALFARLAIFAGGCTLEAAEAVCNGVGEASLDVLDGLSSLADKSLLTVEEHIVPDDTHSRFVMLETIREYAVERMASTHEADTLRRTHAGYFLHMVEEDEPKLVGPEQVLRLALLDRELDNLRAALAWALSTREVEVGLRLSTALWRFWYARGHLTEGRRWLEQFLTLARKGSISETSALVARTHIWTAALAMDQGDYGRAVAAGNEGLSLSERCGDRWGVAFSLNVLGNVAHNQGNDIRAGELFGQGLALFRDLDDRWGIGLSLNNIGMVTRAQGDLERALTAYSESLTIERELGDLWSIAIVLDNLGELARENMDLDEATALHEESLGLRLELGDLRGIADSLAALGNVARQQGDPNRSGEQYEEALTLYRKVGDKWGSAVCLEGLAGTARARGQMEQAARLFGAASALRAAIKHPLAATERRVQEQEVAAVRQDLGEDAFTAAWEAGSVMSWEEIGHETIAITDNG